MSPASAATVLRQRVRVGRRDVEVVRVTPLNDRTASRRSLPPPTAPLLFLHGWTLSAPAMLPVLKPLALRTGRDVYAMSLPAHGSSDPLALRHQNVRGVARHIAAAIEQTDMLDAVGRIDLAGHSFGGGVSLRLGATRPDFVGSLSLFCPVGGAGEAGGHLPLHEALGGIAADAFHRWTPRAGVRTVIPNLVHHPLAFAVSGLAAWRSEQVEDLVAVAEHRIPTVFSFAANDGVVLPGAIAAQCAAHAQSSVVIETVPGRHSWLLTEPHRFVETLARHLASHDDRRAAAA